VDDEGEWTAGTGFPSGKQDSIKIKVPRLMVRLDTTEELTGRDCVLGVIIRTTAYRLADVEPDGGKSHSKLLLAAQGIILLPVTGPGPSDAGAHDYMSGSTTIASAAAAEYRRVGYFAIEDRKSGSLTPKWAAQGCRIFHEPPLGLGSDRQQGGLATFDFKEQEPWLTVLNIA